MAVAVAVAVALDLLAHSLPAARPRPAAAAAPAEAEEAAGAFSRADRASILVSARLSELASCSLWCSPCPSARDCGRVLLKAGRSAPFLSLGGRASTRAGALPLRDR